MIKLRGHHLLCSLTFAGRGYSRDFERDFKKVIQRIKQNEPIEIVSGPDEICASVKDCVGSHCFEDRIINRDSLALRDISALLGVKLEVGSKLIPNDLFHNQYRKAYQLQSVRSACFDCQWSEVCDAVVADGFNKTHLKRG
ncbi:MULTISPECIES: DUF1284 domain-containing protein [unclassified Lentilitoribacter]|uniref:DUF1284 domain-containing protein n=1 Tax=unclassified Lentilitoribacter TaxID=2647570 RepID=UPI0013A6E862|nr:DUF1284 domain-containing protein [Lentilitoribacter sp. Alg239-R112]